MSAISWTDHSFAPWFGLKQLAIDGKAVEVPEFDGRTWTERPAAT